MPERLTPISKARAKLPRLSRSAQKSLDRYIITLQGQPQSVLVGYDEYQSMKAAVELMQRPDVVADIKAGLKELDEGQGVPLSEMKARVREAAQLNKANKLAEELAVESGVDSQTVETVMGHFGEKMRNAFSTNGSMFVPGVGEINVKQPLFQFPREVYNPHFFEIRPVLHSALKKGTGRGAKPARAKREVRLTETEKES